MSLVVMKRKAGTKYGKISSRGTNGFSLNNPRRVEPKTGRMRMQAQTPMRGNVPRGHGSCCGKYSEQIIESQYVNSSPFVRDFSSSASNTGISVKSNAGMIAHKYKWMHGTYPNWVVQDTSPKTGSEYISTVSAQNSAIESGESTHSGCVNGCSRGGVETITKKVDTLSQSEYLKTKFLNKHCLPTPNSKAPFPPSGPRHASCHVDAQVSTEKGNCN